jgi:hypothetical protein
MKFGTGTPVNREWVLVLHSGTVVIDWGDGMFQDVHSGDYIPCREGDISHHVLEEDLDILRRASKVSHWDSNTVYFNNLPERKHRTIE